MSLGTLFADGGLTLLGLLIIALAAGVVIGTTLGYFSASTDLERERARAWEIGAADATVTPLGRPVRNPYRKTLAPEPPHYVIPSPPPGSDAAAARAALYDQDAPTAAARAIELRDDD